MGKTHTVVAGDHLSRIAQKYGFRDFHTIWDHPDNARIKALRVNAHVLEPGDTVAIPDKQPHTESAPTDQTHRFRTDAARLLLRMAIKDFDNQPVAGMACTLTVSGKKHALTSDGDGVIEAEIDRSATDGLLEVPDLGVSHVVRIGFLEPVEVDAGCHERLINLGYYPGSFDDLDAEVMRNAIEEFQCDFEMPVNGELDGATRDKLKEVHGS